MAHAQMAGTKVLIVEDEYYVADDLRSLLLDAGIEVLGPVPTADRARAVIESGGPDAVLLDVNLRGDMAYDLADELHAGHVPFAFVTGYDRSMLPARFAGSPAMAKPLDADQLQSLLSTLLGTDPAATAG